MASAFEVGKRLVELCNADKSLQAVEELYDANIVSIEPMGGPDNQPRKEGIAAIRGKHEWWNENHTIHSGKAEGPWPHGDKFIVRFIYDITAKAGPMAGQRMKVDEAGLYTVANGKVVKEEFFYHMG